MEPEELTYEFLREITDGFSEERKVGQGGFGTVYKGVTKTGVDVAVKIPRDGNNPDLDFNQFQNEFDNLTKVKHVNIVQFLGYCYDIERTNLMCGGRIVRVEKAHRALCFEYLHNGSLQKYLSEESCELDWNTRYNIIKGTCEGLRYIHEEESILHLDLKPDNILLDKKMVPKIADFGLSRIFGDQPIQVSESSFGTLGYKPPEYIDKKRISKKFDIFSLGVIMIRILSGQEGYPKCLDTPSDEFIDQVQRNWKGKLQKTCSGYLLEACCHQVKTCTRIALDCLEEDSQKRPGIVEIINKLKEIGCNNCKETQILQPPNNGHNTLCKMTTQNEMELIEDNQGITGSVGEEVIVGRDEEKKKIMASLLERIKLEKIVILPIYGIGGIGKTTLVKLIYNDTNFKYYSHVWVYVSQRFDLEKIGQSIHSQLSGNKNQTDEILIVLDDLWEDKPLEIEKLKDMLYPVDNIKKVIVLVTTRSADIAQKICSNIDEPYQIEPLIDEMCWEIIKQKSVFEDKPDKEKLVDTGIKIAQKCRGVALAAQTLGSMLHSMEYDHQWIRVRDNSIWNETISKDASSHVLASLKLSYDYIKDDFLKKCFMYCAIFPKGHKIVKRDLFYQWISLGFIKESKMFSILQLCEKYIMRLQGLSFLQQYSLSPTTYQAYVEYDTVFTMHDLVHDLAVSLLGDRILDQSEQPVWDCSSAVRNRGGSRSCYALLTDCSKPLESCMTSPATLSALRFAHCWTIELHGAAFEPAESLRVLDLGECSIQKLPDSIGGLKQMRYLNAPRVRDRMVPECIAKFSNLRYLNLHGSCAIRALPESIGELEGLEHLDLSGCTRIGKLPESFGNLKRLEHVDFSDCINVTGVSECLAGFTKLQYLNLSTCTSVGDLPIALGSLTELQYLNLSGSSYLDGQKLGEAEFWGSLTKLKYLNLSKRIKEVTGKVVGCDPVMNKFPKSFGKLCNLVHLDLSHCFFRQDVSSALNGLTKLQYLDLSLSIKSNYFGKAIEGHPEVFGSLSELRHLNLKYYIDEIGGGDKINILLDRICTLTNLEYLNLASNEDISSIPEALGNLKKLHTLDLSYCNGLRRLPASISELDSLSCIYTNGLRRLPASILETSTIPQSKSISETSRWCRLTGLEKVKSAKEARAIKFANMTTNISDLRVEWTRDAERFVDDAEVLGELDPPYSVTKFGLKGYNSVRFPSWMTRIDAYLPHLTRISLEDMPSCNNLPPLGQLQNLHSLCIRKMDGIKEMGADLYGGPRAFPRLKWFYIEGMKCLEEWNTVNSSDEDDLKETMFPCLSSVSISDCPRLRFKPRPPRSMQDNFKLSIERSDEVMLSPGGTLATLLLPQ